MVERGSAQTGQPAPLAVDGRSLLPATLKPEKAAPEPMKSALPKEVMEILRGNQAPLACPGLRATPVTRLGRRLALP